jgi:Chlorophyllase enzyme
MAGLNNPGLGGDVQFDTVIYASAGVNYSAVAALAQYFIYDTPDPAYVTGRINISAFAQLGSAPWPFANTNVPLNGHICIPRGRGPFPLAVFAHGNHDPAQNSTPGYMYLCQLLASHGVITATIDVNFLNGNNFGENDARAIVHLEHVKQFRAWNNLATHPLHAKVDLNRIMIAGHSRGGEGVGHASFFNRLNAVQPDSMSAVVPLDGSAGLGPYHFAVTLVAAIAPTDRQYIPVTGPTVVPDRYFLIHGSRDGDVSNFVGYNTYNRAHAVDLANPTVSDGELKALLWVYGANHNQFNSTWPSETPPATTIPRASQEQIAKVYFGTLANALLLDRAAYLDVLRDHAATVTWVPAGANFVSQYQDPGRIYLQHNQEGVAAPVISLPVQGSVIADAVVATRQLVDLANAGAPQTTITLRLEWSALGARYALRVDPATLPAERYGTLSLRVGQSIEPKNAADHDQDFTLEVSSGSRTLAIPASALHRLIYPDVVSGVAKIVMQTLRLPVERLVESGVELTDLRSIAFVFDRRASGVLYVGEVQVSN